VMTFKTLVKLIVFTLVSACAHQDIAVNNPIEPVPRKIERIVIFESCDVDVENIQNNDAVKLNDLLNVKVYQEDDLSGDYRVVENGNIYMPLIGRIKISGLDYKRAAQAIRNAYINKGYLINPYITVQPKSLDTCNG